MESVSLSYILCYGLQRKKLKKIKEKHIDKKIIL